MKSRCGECIDASTSASRAAAPPLPRTGWARRLLSPLAVAVLTCGAHGAVAEERTAAPPRVDWGGGYFKGGDSASNTAATSGAAQRGKPAAAAAPPAPPPTDWGGGYSKGGDSASSTPATSGGAERARNGKR